MDAWIHPPKLPGAEGKSLQSRTLPLVRRPRDRPSPPSRINSFGVGPATPRCRFLSSIFDVCRRRGAYVDEARTAIEGRIGLFREPGNVWDVQEDAWRRGNDRRKTQRTPKRRVRSNWPMEMD